MGTRFYGETIVVLASAFVIRKRYGDDPSIVVIDEIVGMWITLLFLPKSFMISLIAFILFRAHDIVKIPPARQLESLRNGFGIMLDDVVAGAYANLSVWIAIALLEMMGVRL